MTSSREVIAYLLAHLGGYVVSTVLSQVVLIPAMVASGMVAAKDLKIFDIVDTAEEAWTVAPALEVTFDVKNWDASQAVVAPGQSAAPDSPHFADLAPLWLRGAAAPLRFSEVGINDAAETRLTLIPQ